MVNILPKYCAMILANSLLGTLQVHTVEALRRLKCLTSQIRVSQIIVVNVQAGKSMLATSFSG